MCRPPRGSRRRRPRPDPLPADVSRPAGHTLASHRMVRSVGCGLMMMRIQRITVNAIANLRPTRITRPTLQNGKVVGQKDIGEARPEGRGRDEVERVPLASVGLPAIRSSTMRLAQVTVVVPIAVRSS